MEKNKVILAPVGFSDADKQLALVLERPFGRCRSGILKIISDNWKLRYGLHQ